MAKSSELLTRYGTLLSELSHALDLALHRGELEAAGKRYAELAAFVEGLAPDDRADFQGVLGGASGGQADVAVPRVPGWNTRNQRRLWARWEALNLHRGSWQGWQGLLAMPLASKPAAQAIRESAKDLVYRHSPEKSRPALWCFCVGHAQVQGAEIESMPKRPELIEGAAERKELEEMLCDINRIMGLEEEHQDTVANILLTYCAKSAEVGHARRPYVQGMHMLAVCPLWAGLAEPDALVVFEWALNKLCHGYYADSSFVTFRRDVHVVEVLIKERLPMLWTALRAEGVSTMLLTFDPLLCLFTRHVPRAATLRLWDVMLLEGDASVFAVILSLLERLLPELSARGSSVEGSGTPKALSSPMRSFPIVERFKELSESLDGEQDVENLLRRVQFHLEMPVGPVAFARSADAERAAAADRPRGPPLQQRVQQLRREAEVAGVDSFEVDCMEGGLEADGRTLTKRAATPRDSEPAWWDQVAHWWGWEVDRPPGSPVGCGSPRSPHKAKGGQECSIVDLGQRRGSRGMALSEYVAGGPAPGDHVANVTPAIEVEVVLSETYVPGASFKIRGPHGLLEVDPPPDAQPGSKVRFRLAPPPEFEMRVPEGYGPGEPVTFKRADGVEVVATVPKNARPGDTITVMPPALMVLVPEKVKPGDSVIFHVQAGMHGFEKPGWCRTEIPPGVKPGKYFAARLPPPPAPKDSWLPDWLKL